MKSRPIILYLLVYALFLAAMHFGYGFGVAEPLLVLLVFGLGLSLLALWSTRHAKLRNITVKHPSILIAIGYSVVVTSPAGFFLGVLWIRTRNLLLLALVHTAGDLLPHLAETIRLWR